MLRELYVCPHKTSLKHAVLPTLQWFVIITDITWNSWEVENCILQKWSSFGKFKMCNLTQKKRVGNNTAKIISEEDNRPILGYLVKRF